MQQRNIALYIVLTFVTCGFFGLYWYYSIANDMDQFQTPTKVSTSPGVSLLLFIITCTIYGWYTWYIWGKQSSEIMAMYGRPIDDNKGVLYLVLAIIELSIINMGLLQNDLNTLTAPPPPPYGGDYNQQAYGYGQQPYQQPGYDQQAYQQPEYPEYKEPLQTPEEEEMVFPQGSPYTQPPQEPQD